MSRPRPYASTLDYGILMMLGRLTGHVVCAALVGWLYAVPGTGSHREE